MNLHRLRLLAALSLRRPLEELERLAEAPSGRGLEELLLGAEEAEEVRLRDAGPPGDVLGRRAFEAALGELDQGRVEDVVLALRRCQPYCHGRKLVMTHNLVKCLRHTVEIGVREPPVQW